jgi:hypothetical protein
MVSPSEVTKSVSVTTNNSTSGPYSATSELKNAELKTIHFCEVARENLENEQAQAAQHMQVKQISNVLMIVTGGTLCMV